MKALDFLQLVWPSQGHYCITTPRKKSDSDDVWWFQKVFDTIEDAVTFAHGRGHIEDQYFAVLSLRERFIVDERKRQKAIAEGWKNQTGHVIRVKENMAWARSLFVDLDVGDDPQKKFPSQAVAILTLKDFCKSVGLPKPYMVSSGRGVHVYWPFDADVASSDWLPIAQKLKQLASYHGFKIDPTRTADLSSVLRVPGTMHLKDRDNPLKVRVIAEGAPPTAFDVISGIIAKACQLLPTGEPVSVPLPSMLQIEQTPIKLGRIAKACAQVRHLIEHPDTQTEPSWYKLLGVVRFALDGRKMAHLVSKGYTGYDPAETDKKLDHLEGTTADGREIGPSTCGGFADVCGPTRCHACWFKKQTVGWEKSSPLVAARRLPLDAQVGIPDPPKPYTRVKDGILMGGDEPRFISPYDLYPVQMIDDPKNRQKSSLWEIVLPRHGKKQFVLTTEELHDMRLFNKLLGNNGFQMHVEESKWVKHYMTAYIRTLQEYMDEQRQHGHLGWTEDRDAFVLPVGEIAGGKTKPTILTEQCESASAAVHANGSIERQKQLLRFYNEPMYLRHQFLIGASLASPLFYMTGHHGSVVNLTGASGASKSTALYAASSIWGEPETYAINGTASGGSTKGKNNRAHILSNLPFCVDEVTNISREEARELVMGFTQKGGKIILTQSSTERKSIGTTKSSLMLLTSNNSIHELLSHQNQAGTAGSMRLFEIATPRVARSDMPDYQAKALADDFMAGLRLNYGHIGPAFMAHVTDNLDQVYNEVRAEQARFDKLSDVKQQERFWSAVASVTIYTLKLASKLGLLPYDAGLVEQWLVEQQMASMRGVVNDSYMGAVDTILAYLSASYNNFLIVSATDKGATVKEGFQGAFAGQLDTSAMRVTAFISHLKAYAARERIQLNTLLSELEHMGIAYRIKATPGAGTIYAVGQHPCISIDMTHPAISGHERVKDLDKVVAIRRAG